MEGTGVRVVCVSGTGPFSERFNLQFTAPSATKETAVWLAAIPCSQQLLDRGIDVGATRINA